MLVGAAPKALNEETSIGETGTRILKPARSFGVSIGFPLAVIWRKPWSHILGCTTKLTLSKADRMCVRGRQAAAA